jgi:GNAT superfamily N-acetyltransferase
MEQMDRLRCYTARSISGDLIGYAIWFLVRGHPHYRYTTYAHNDIVYIDPSHRGGAGIRLLKYAEEQLRSDGVQVLSLHIKTSFDWGPLAKRMGYEHTEVLYNKWVGD